MLENAVITSTMDKVKSFWNEFDLKSWSQDVGGSYSEAIQAIIYFSVCFAFGFIVKRYFKFILGCLIVSILLIKGMEYYKLLEIDWGAVKTLLGIPANKKEFIPLLLNACVEWIKMNLVSSIASLIGFLIGYRLG